MKKTIFFFLALISFSSCKRTITNGPQIQFEGEDTVSGLVSVLVSGTGEDNKKLATGKNILEDIASKRAFEQILFIGLPNSINYRLPLTPNASLNREDNPFLKQFFESKDYRRFISEIVSIREQQRSTNYRKNMRFRVTINGDAFRKYLEQNSQIRKFGY